MFGVRFTEFGTISYMAPILIGLVWSCIGET